MTQLATRPVRPIRRHVEYEAAFADYLHAHGIAHVAVDEARRAAFRDAKLKSFDFIVYAPGGPNWLVDIKGRRWATRRSRPGGRPGWENWATLDDLAGLSQWEQVFGSGFAALLVFAYRIEAGPDPPAEVVHRFRDQRYVFAGVPVATYRLHARLRSPKWGTVSMPVAEFARHVRPIASWLGVE